MARLLIVPIAGFALLAVEALATPVPPPPAPVAPPPREAEHYFPTTVGAKWVYIRTTGQRTDEVVDVVTAVRPAPAGGKVIKVGTLLENGRVLPTRTFEASNRGLLWTEHRYELPLSQPARFLALPHYPGQTWYDPHEETTKTAFGPEPIEVPAGVFNCIRVEYRANGRTETLWYARGVGEVKAMTGDAHVVLKSFTPGNGRAP